MQSFQLKSRPPQGKAAFTLVEMLVIIAIISILMTAGSIGLGGMNGKGVTSGVATAESLFDEARTTAIGRNLRSCVLVANSLNYNSAENLRRIVVAYEEVDANGLPKAGIDAAPNWVLSSRGAVLPDQTFFSKVFSKKDHAAGTGSIDEITNAKFAGDSAKKKSYEGRYFIYEFNAQGICKTPGASFIIGSGARDLTKSTNASQPRVTASSKRDFGGFVIWGNGRTSVFRSPDQMDSTVGSLTTGTKF